MIVVFTGETTPYGYAATIQGIEEAARAAGYMVVISVVESDHPDTVERAVDHALGQPLAGAIVLEYDPAGAATISHIPKWLPAVAAASGWASDNANAHTYMDDRVAAAQATRYLLDLGHETVHHVAIPSTGGEARTLGWKDALTEAGIEPPAIRQVGWDPLAARDVGVVMAENPEVTAVLAGNDEVAMGLIKGLTDAGRKVPDDVSVIGFDDHPLSQIWAPPLTTVRQDFVRLGHRAVELLLERLRTGEPRPSVRIVPDLVVRESTRRPPAAK